MYVHKIEEENMELMKTIVLIPTHPAPVDPTWLTKRHAGRKLNALEAQEYYKDVFDRELEWLKVQGNWNGIPGRGQLGKVILMYHDQKNAHIQSHRSCSMSYNKAIFSGAADECGSIDMFRIWNENISEKNAKLIVEKLID